MKKEEFDFFDSTSIKSYNLDSTIQYQLKMLDSLDVYTRKHSENVANITCKLCEKLHLDKGFTVYCITCAYIHDIGKMFIPYQILQKPSALTPEEYEQIKSHTTIGYKMCMEDPKLRPYAAGPLYHHESLDGTGYPNGVKGNKIPYECQIIKVADEFEAITAKRQYKTHIGIVDALNILVEQSKPNPDSTSEGLKKLKHEAAVGKIDKTILKALFKVVIDDTEYEIYVRTDYLNYLQKEIKRIKGALKYYHKMEKAKNEEEREYRKEELRYYLKPDEDPEKVPDILTELQNAYKTRYQLIYKLYDEVKKIKKMKI